MRLQSPYTYTDTTDYRDGWELSNLEAVLSWYRRNDFLFESKTWGNLFDYELKDSRGTAFRIERGPRNGLRIVY